jgi:phenylacetate-CoA ligase
MATPGGLVLRDRRSDALRVWWDTRQAHRHGPEAIRARHRERLAELVGFAREHSAYYRRLYQGLPGRIEDVTVLPVTDKAELMAHFDEVSTDPAVTREVVEAFVADPARGRPPGPIRDGSGQRHWPGSPGCSATWDWHT